MACSPCPWCSPHETPISRDFDKAALTQSSHLSPQTKTERTVRGRANISTNYGIQYQATSCQIIAYHFSLHTLRPIYLALAKTTSGHGLIGRSHSAWQRPGGPGLRRHGDSSARPHAAYSRRHVHIFRPHLFIVLILKSKVGKPGAAPGCIGSVLEASRQEPRVGLRGVVARNGP